MPSFTGDSSNNLLTGGSGDDIVSGLNGDDTLYGGAGNDRKMPTNLTMDSYNSDTTKALGSAWMSPNMPLNLSTTTEVKLVGVLSGDVDGSWTPA